MAQVFIRCYAELNNFLPNERQYSTFSFIRPQNTRIGILLKEIEIPIENVDLILVNGESVDASYILQENDRISLYPVFETFDISSVTKLSERPLRQPRFVVDVHLGKLANYLRMFGFDTLYKNNFSSEDLLLISNNEGRTLLSKNKSLLDNGSLTRAFFIKDTDPRFQLIDVLERFDLFSSARPFTRCITCNSLLQHVDKHSIRSRIPPKVLEYCDEYQHCTTCDQIYWKGSHYTHMQNFIQDILEKFKGYYQSNKSSVR